MVTKITTAKCQLQEELTFFFALKTFFMKNLVKNRVRITHGRVLYTGKYGILCILSLFIGIPFDRETGISFTKNAGSSMQSLNSFASTLLFIVYTGALAGF